MNEMLRTIGYQSKYQLYVTCSRDRTDKVMKVITESVSGNMALDRIQCREADGQTTELEVDMYGKRLLDSWLGLFLMRLGRERGIRSVQMQSAL